MAIVKGYMVLAAGLAIAIAGCSKTQEDDGPVDTTLNDQVSPPVPAEMQSNMTASENLNALDSLDEAARGVDSSSSSTEDDEPSATLDETPRATRMSARAKGSLVGLFSSDDYPSSALAANEQGTVGVSLTIGPDGRIAECNVTASSGSSALDSATCSILQRRARFTPAYDDRGEPTSDTYAQRITWSVPSG